MVLIRHFSKFIFNSSNKLYFNKNVKSFVRHLSITNVTKSNTGRKEFETNYAFENEQESETQKKFNSSNYQYQGDENESTTHFGYETVKASEKNERVHKVFEQVANSYDLMNDAMSLGIHRVWKDIFVERLGPDHGTKLLDMAGGTGDIAFRYIKYLQGLPNGKSKLSHVTISDINQNMLNVGKTRAERLGYTEDNLKNIDINWVCADAENLPFEDDSFTAYTIAFGVRNCTNIENVLDEAYRVLQPGGRFMCLEFSHLTNETLQWLYDQYSFEVIPPMGQILAGQWQPYQYLVESIRNFPKQETFKAMIKDAGFLGVKYENLSFGVVSIHSGFKL